MNDGCGRLLLFRGRGIISTLIRWQTRGVYSHAALIYPDGKTIIEAWQGDGVRKKEVTDWENIDQFAVIGSTPGQWQAALAWAEERLGEPYDYIGVARFVTRRKDKEDGKWFCSELAFGALKAARIRLLERIDGWAVSPQMLSYSPLLIPETVIRSRRWNPEPCLT